MLKLGMLNFLLFFWSFFEPTKTEIDVSNKPFAQEFVGKCVELKEDAFLFRFSDTKELDMALPGKIAGNSWVPFSVEDYDSRPKDWWKTEAYRKSYRDSNCYHGEILGVLTKGTRLLIKKVVLKKFTSHSSHLCYLEVLEGPFKGTISFSQFFRSKPLGTSENLTMNTRALKWCDETSTN